MTSLNPPPGTRQPSGRLTYACVLDLSVDRPTLVHEVNALADPRWAGRQVTLRLGPASTFDLDPRIPSLLREALDLGVSLHLEGPPGAVRQLWDRIRPTVTISGRPIPRRRHRHLRPVRPT